MIVRPAQHSDIEGIAHVGVEVFHTAYDHAFPHPDAPNQYLAETYAPEAIAGAINHDAALLRVAVQGDQVAGFVWMKEEHTPECIEQRPAVEISKFYLLPEFQGRGVADSLMDDAVRTAEERGNAGVWLCVWEHNARALRFYTRWGFRHVGLNPVVVGGVLFNDLIVSRAVAEESLKGA